MPSPSRKTQRTLAILAITCACVSACSTTVAGHPRAVSTGGTAATGTSSQSLHDLLEAAPEGSAPWGDAWSAEVTPTVDDFVARVYPAPSRAAESARLHSQGILAIAHRTWVTTDGHEADLVLLSFATDAGARTRLGVAVSAKSTTAGVRSFDVPGRPGVVGYYDPAIDDDGNYRAIVYGQKSNIVVELFFYCPEPFSSKDAIDWTSTQLDMLG